jgi:hypothetical protein
MTDQRISKALLSLLRLVRLDVGAVHRIPEYFDVRTMEFLLLNQLIRNRAA